MNDSLEPTALVLGSIAFDYIMECPENYYEALAIDHESKVVQGTFLSLKKLVRFGGTAGNISYNMAKLGGKPIVVASVGPDYFSLEYEKHLRENNIDARVHVVDSDTTASCYVFNDSRKNQITVFHGGALNFGERIDLKTIITPEDNVKIAINAPNNMDAMVKHAMQLKDMGIPSIFDPGQMINALSEEQFKTILGHSSAFISNIHEYEAVKKRFGIDLLDLKDKLDWIIITRGADGSVIHTAGETIEVPLVPASDVVDPTGAGDAFRGGLLRGLTAGLDLVHAARLGSVMGSINVENAGGQGYEVNMDVLRARYKEAFNEELPI